MNDTIKKSFRLLFLVLTIALPACTEKKTVVKTQVVSDRPQPAEGGTDNAGGGNGVNGKPFESYIEKNIESKPYFAQQILPLISKIYELDKRLAADFYHITLERVWYFVPTEIDKISNVILGSYGKHDQFALQDLKKVWVNSLLFDQMSESSQATLMIHEIIMGLRLMRYNHKQDQCIAKAALSLFDDTSRKTYGTEKRKCRREYPYISGAETPRFRLNSDDYDLIRRIVSLLDRQSPDVEEAISLMESNGYR